MREFDFDSTLESDHCVTLQFPEDVPPGRYLIRVQLELSELAGPSQTPGIPSAAAGIIEERGMLLLSAPPIPGLELEVIELAAEIRRENEERKLGSSIER